MKNLSPKWQKIIIWLVAAIPCAIPMSALAIMPYFINVLALLIVGGFVFLKTEDESVKKTAKLAFISTAIYTALMLLCVILLNCFTAAYDDMNYLNMVVAVLSFEVIKIIYFVTCFVLDMFGILGKAKYFGLDCFDKKEKPAKEEKAEEVEPAKKEEPAAPSEDVNVD